jgi:hypothetical protein
MCHERDRCDTAGIYTNTSKGYWMSKKLVGGECVTECLLPIIEVGFHKILMGWNCGQQCIECACNKKALLRGSE